MNARVLDPLTDPRWDERLAGLPGATVFHTRAWAEVMASTYRFARHYVVQEDGAGLSALAPCMEVRHGLRGARAVCLPYSDFAPITARCASDARILTMDLLAHARQQRWRAVELRGGGEPWLASQLPSRSYYRHSVELLADEAEMFRRLRGSVRTAIRQARARGVSVARTIGDSGSSAFRRLNRLTRKRHGLPPQPVRFLDNINRLLLRTGCGDIWLASCAEQPIAAALFLTHGDRVTYKYGASDYRFQQLRSNDLLLWSAMCGYAAQGFRSMCLGRTDMPNEGLRRFKENLGARQQIDSYYTYDVRRSEFVSAPARDSAWVGGVVRHLPGWVNQCLGNCFYRLAA